MSSGRYMTDAEAISYEERMLVTPSPEEQRRLDENRKRRDLQSKSMSELLLKGWKMLGEHCPVTGEVPLMQQPKTGRKFSVALNQFLDELKPIEAEAPAPIAVAPSMPMTAVSSDAPSPRAPPTPAPAPSPRVPAVVPEPAAPAAAASGAHPAVGGALDTAAAEVAAKLQTYTQQLRASSHSGEAHALLGLIGECARVLGAINAAKASAN